jgi:DNA polymerase alpha subunit B
MTRPLFVGVGLCQTFALAPQDLYYKWESLVITSHAIGQRYIDNSTCSAIRTIIQSELERATLSQKFKTESGLRKTRGTDAMGMLGLGTRMKLPAVGLVDTAPVSQPSFVTPRSIGKAGTSTITFKCSDIEDDSRGKRNCTLKALRGDICSLNNCDQINICTRRSCSEVTVSASW